MMKPGQQVTVGPYTIRMDKLTVTDLLVRACALTLIKFPEVNSSWLDGRFERKRRHGNWAR